MTARRFAEIEDDVPRAGLNAAPAPRPLLFGPFSIKPASNKGWRVLQQVHERKR